jgi:hypothetical protein
VIDGNATSGRLRQWLWRPPRAHGEVVADRTVSFLELFYDLVYVAVIGQAAHHLAEHVTARGAAEFAIVRDPGLAVGPPCSLSWREGPESDRAPPDLDQRLGLAAKPIAKR